MEQNRIDGAMRRAAMQVQPCTGGGVFVLGKEGRVRDNRTISELRIINALCNLYGDRAVSANWAALQSIVESGASPGRALPAAIRVMGV